MKRGIAITLTVVLAASACGRDSFRRDPEQYEVVDEGSASGVTSTIQGPGETLPPITGTNADTTTAFTIDPATATGTMPPYSPVPPPHQASTYTPPTEYNPPQPPTHTTPSPAPEPAPTPEPEPAPQPEPEPADAAEEEVPEEAPQDPPPPPPPGR